MFCMQRKNNTKRKLPEDALPKLRQPDKKEIKKPSIKDCLFEEDLNPAINIIRNAAKWFMLYWPDFMSMQGWRKWVRRIATVAILLHLTFSLAFEGVTAYGIIFRALVMTSVASLLWANYIGFTVYTFLLRWENLKETFK